MEVSPKVKKVWNVVSTILVIIVVLFALLLVGARLIGLQVYTVLSGSMEPTFSPGDLIYVRKVDPAEVKVGDPITFVLNEDLVIATHRVIEIDAENQHFYTKGDANDMPDVNPVHYNNLIGVPVYSLPYLGYVSNWVQNPPGMYVAIAAIIILLLIVFVPDFVDMRVKKQTEEALKNAEESKKLEEESKKLEEQMKKLEEERKKLEEAAKNASAQQ